MDILVGIEEIIELTDFSFKVKSKMSWEAVRKVAFQAGRIILSQHPDTDKIEVHCHRGGETRSWVVART